MRLRLVAGDGYRISRKGALAGRPLRVLLAGESDRGSSTLDPAMLARMFSVDHLTTVVVPVRDQETALAFYVERLGLEKVSDFSYETGERWLEVAPRGSTVGLTLVEARPERPAGIETGIVFACHDAQRALEELRAAGVTTDPGLLPKGVVTWWAGAPLAGHPDQFRVFDPDGNSLLIVAAP
jgi:catechol 2,3-dioxygenase-like lactoylglutathione lyase family enzyme